MVVRLHRGPPLGAESAAVRGWRERGEYLCRAGTLRGGEVGSSEAVPLNHQKEIRQGNLSGTEAPNPECLLHGLIRLHLQNTNPKRTLLRISRCQLQSIKLYTLGASENGALDGHSGPCTQPAKLAQTINEMRFC